MCHPGNTLTNGLGGGPIAGIEEIVKMSAVQENKAGKKGTPPHASGSTYTQGDCSISAIMPASQPPRPGMRRLLKETAVHNGSGRGRCPRTAIASWRDGPVPVRPWDELAVAAAVARARRYAVEPAVRAYLPRHRGAVHVPERGADGLGLRAVPPARRGLDDGGIYGIPTGVTAAAGREEGRGPGAENGYAAEERTAGQGRGGRG